MKRIEERKLYHMSNFHKRHFEMVWNRAIIIVKKFGGKDDPVHKKIPINSIRNVKIKDQEVVDEDGNDTGFKRSRSWLSKVRKTNEELCVWNFCFELEMNDRSMELYAPTRQDREKWVMLFKLLSEMNERLISTRTMSPLEFQKQLELEAKQKE